MKQYLSTLRSIKKNGALDLGTISSCEELPSFDALTMAIQNLRGTTDTAKMALFGYVPSLFQRTRHPTRNTVGVWRCEAGEIDRISSLVMDIDNDKPFPLATWNHVKALGWTAFGYDSYSGNGRFRIVFETDRHMNRVEVRKVMAILNRDVFHMQADMSMSHAAHYAIAPAAHANDYYVFGKTLPVDSLVADCEAAIAKGCDYLPKAAIKGAKSLPNGVKACPSLVNNLEGDPARCAWVSQADLAEYAASAKGHWIGMFVALQRVFKRAGGVLTFGDMLYIAEHIDTAANGYFGNKYGDEGFVARITDAMDVDIRPDWT